MKTDEKLTHITENLRYLTEFMMDHTNNYTRLFSHQCTSYPYRTTLHTSSFKIPKGGNNMDNKYDEQFIIIQSKIYSNKK